MNKTVLLLGLCLLLCTSVSGLPQLDYERNGLDNWDDYYVNNDYDPPYMYNPYEARREGSPEEDRMLKMAVLDALVEDVSDALRAITLETVPDTGEDVSDTKRRFKFGKFGRKKKKPLKWPSSWPKIKPLKWPSSWPKIKPLKFPSSWHNPPTIQLPDIHVNFDPEIVLPPPTNSSGHEDNADSI